MITAQQLKEIDLFYSLPGVIQEELIRVSRLTSLQSNETLFKEGEKGVSVFVVLSGRLTVLIENQEVSLIRQGELFGEMALMERKTRSVTVISSCETELLEIPQEFFFSLLSTQNSFLFSALETMSRRCRSNMQDLALSYQKIKTQDRLSSQLHQIIDSTPSEILIFDQTTGKMVRSNLAGIQQLGYLPSEISRLTLFDLFCDLVPEQFASKIYNLISGKESTLKFQTQVSRKDGSEYSSEVQISPLGEYSDTLYFAVLQNHSIPNPALTAQGEQSNYDSLTGLPNRNLVNDRIQIFQAHAERSEGVFGLIVLDIDNFKILNEALGPKEGDEILKMVANRLVQFLRKEDTVARLGSDEFLLLLNLKEEEDATRLGKKLLNLFEQPFSVNKEEVRLGISLGISMYPHDGKDPTTLLMGADAAMHRAKDMGKGTFQYYNSALLSRAAHKLKLENAMYRALEEDQFTLYYQPKISTKTSQILGVEALIRWNHPERGLVSPGEFIPIAESSRFIVPLGEWVLETACKTIQHWKQLGFPNISVAVNISGYQFNHGNIVQTVSDLLDKTGVLPNLLELELTETILLNDSQRSMSRVNQLKELGVQLALDDFGTGYSSLTYLKNLPINNLKIDRSFVQNMNQERNHAIIKAIITLAKTLNLTTIAEGVEEESERELLDQLDCDQIQGFLFSRPIPLRDMNLLLQKSALTEASQAQ